MFPHNPIEPSLTPCDFAQAPRRHSRAAGATSPEGRREGERQPVSRDLSRARAGERVRERDRGCRKRACGRAGGKREGGRGGGTTLSRFLGSFAAISRAPFLPEGRAAPVHTLPFSTPHTTISSGRKSQHAPPPATTSAPGLRPSRPPAPRPCWGTYHIILYIYIRASLPCAPEGVSLSRSLSLALYIYAPPPRARRAHGLTRCQEHLIAMRPPRERNALGAI